MTLQLDYSDRFAWFLCGATKKKDRTCFLLQLAYTRFVEALVRPARPVCRFSSRIAFRELGSGQPYGGSGWTAQKSFRLTVGNPTVTLFN
jgi:hypothetical protein